MYCVTTVCWGFRYPGEAASGPWKFTDGVDYLPSRKEQEFVVHVKMLVLTAVAFSVKLSFAASSATGSSCSFRCFHVLSDSAVINNNRAGRGGAIWEQDYR